jgi:hypothetical protein
LQFGGAGLSSSLPAVRREFKLRAEQVRKRLLEDNRQLQASRQEKGSVEIPAPQK